MKKYITKITIILTFLFLLGSYCMYLVSSEVPIQRPYVSIKYKNKAIPSKIGEHNWFRSETGGNSFIVGSSYKVGKETSIFTAKSGDALTISFSAKPKEMKVILYSNKNTTAKVYKTFGSEKNYELMLPKEQGEYIFEVSGHWDDTHNTSDIFRVKIE